MVSKADLNKLLKRELEDICTQTKVEIPSKVKTKKDLVEFMTSYKDWPQDLDEVLKSQKSSSKPKSKRTSRTSTRTSKRATPEIDMSQIQALVDKLGSDLKQSLLKEMDSKIAGVKSSIIASIPKPSPTPVPNPNTSTLSASSAISESKIKTMISSELEQYFQQEMDVLEAIPEEEFAFLEDVSDFAEGIPPARFKQIIKHLHLLGVIEGDEGEDGLSIELVDETLINAVKRKN